MNLDPKLRGWQVLQRVQRHQGDPRTARRDTEASMSDGAKYLAVAAITLSLIAILLLVTKP